MISRANRTPIAEWWWTVDRTMLGLTLVLYAAGLVLSLAASPAVAERIGLPSLHFVLRHAFYAPFAAALVIGLSFLTPRQVRRAALVLLLVSLAMMILVLFVGAEVKGSRRWIYLGGLSLQPSEFMKPAFIVITAWLFAEGSDRPDVPGRLLAVLLLVIVAALLVAEPDLGQTMLTLAVWGALFFLAGVSPILVAGLGGISVAGLAAAYTIFPHVSERINRFLDPSSGDTFQVDTAIQSFERGGWSGTGPGEGVMKRILPDSHTDFVFAVVAEEFGILICMLLMLLFAGLVIRGLMQAFRRKSAFERLAIAGLATQIGMQSFINMGVNLNILPAKGMTLPFISYGGSALLSAAVTMGFLLALSRRSYDQHVTVVPRAAAVGHT
ncbi:putative lipid II flippase FtsW [Propylenella binzhouense]|uniref:Probable peptidoglycan glycosyltransferase FtsW n=1 Tax=Propylenella binzhouense TaxID=2555902 RepID=A0A964T4I9_9HYPH|nr:putative lipid II flippase FtsW [Propylenella binzhouense]